MCVLCVCAVWVGGMDSVCLSRCSYIGLCKWVHATAGIVILDM